MPGTRTLLEDVRGRLWVGSSAGLGRIDAPGAPRQHIALSRAEDEDPWYLQQDENVYALYQDSAERIWVGTWAGLHILNGDGTPLARYRVPEGLPGPILWDIHRHIDGSLWLASNGGLVRVVNPDDVQALKFEASGMLAGIPGGTVYGMASDLQGLLWITGNRGLTRFDPATRRFDIWRSRDGIASDEFATGSLTTGARGMLYFGGIDGLTAIDPSQLRGQAELPRPALARVQLGDDPVSLQKGPDGEIPSVQLRDDHAPLILDFTGLVFDAPQNARYAYRTDPNLPFTGLGNRRSLSLDRLPAGDHVVELNVENNGRSAAAQLLQLDVAPPMYATWQFRLALATGVVVALLLTYGWRVRALTAQGRRLEAEVAARTRELRNQKEALEATAEALATANIKLKTLSAMDPLTGLPNRRELIDRVTEALRDRSIQPRLALAVIDLDHFKRINDDYGHLAGDAVLRDFAGVLHAHVRGHDAIGRWGGEEFLALLPGAGAEDARRWIDELIARVRQRLVIIDGNSIAYRISIGIALADDGDAMDALVARADRALYAAKAAGRDCGLVA
jgi:diguanylate cyclase (GGDEF)-like protein